MILNFYINCIQISRQEYKVNNNNSNNNYNNKYNNNKMNNCNSNYSNNKIKKLRRRKKSNYNI